MNKNKPLGDYGDKTLNEILIELKNLNWDVIFYNLKLTMNVVPAAAFAL